jgi:hypothetical protein
MPDVLIEKIMDSLTLPSNKNRFSLFSVVEFQSELSVRFILIVNSKNPDQPQPRELKTQYCYSNLCAGKLPAHKGFFLREGGYYSHAQLVAKCRCHFARG